MPPAAVQPPNPSCDRCRGRKVKCVPIDNVDLPAARAKGVGDRCKGCYKAGKACTRVYIHKKPGRPLGSGRSRSSRATLSPVALSPVPPTCNTAALCEDGTGPAFGSIFGSAKTALSYAPAFPLFDPTLDPLELVLNTASAGSTDAPASAPAAVVPPVSTATHVGMWRDVSSASSLPPDRAPVQLDIVEFGKDYEQGHSPDDVLPWSDVCFFVSLYLKNQHCLSPIVHKPSFSQDVLNRRDKHDEGFRGLLASMVAYTICQCPVSTMIGFYERPRLATMLHRCTKAADSIRHRQRLNPSLNLLAGTILAWATACAVGNTQARDLHIAEVTRLVHVLGLVSESPKAATNVIEEQLCRRLFWVIYSCDKTDALSGRPIILHDFEGVPPLPLPVDDDYITAVGHLPQPPTRTSYMVGFITIMRIFQVISQCISRHRSFANLAENDDSDHVGMLRWIRTAQDRLRDIVDSVPPSLRTNLADMVTENPDDLSLFGIQQANITISVLVAEFALLDFRASLRPDEDTSAEREEMACKAYTTLSSIPYEYLASNGESMRGKVLRTILALLSNAKEPGNFSQSVWDWWNMYSRVQFLQVIPDEGMLMMDQSSGGAVTAGISTVAEGTGASATSNGLDSVQSVSITSV